METYTADPKRTYRALVAPGCTTVVAVEGTTVAGLVQLQSDGEIQAHLSALVVGREWRGRGLARAFLAWGRFDSRLRTAEREARGADTALPWPSDVAWRHLGCHDG